MIPGKLYIAQNPNSDCILLQDVNTHIKVALYKLKPYDILLCIKKEHIPGFQNTIGNDNTPIYQYHFLCNDKIIYCYDNTIDKLNLTEIQYDK